MLLSEGDYLEKLLNLNSKLNLQLFCHDDNSTDVIWLYDALLRATMVKVAELN